MKKTLSLGQPYTTDLPEKAAGDLAARFAQSNRRLVDSTGLDLATYGYEI